MMRRMNILLLILLLMLTACSQFTEAEQLVQQPTSTTVRVVQTTPVPTVNRQLHPVPSAAATAETATVEAADVTPTASTPCEATAGQSAVAHTVTATLNFREQSAAVEQAIRFINRTSDTLAELVLDVEPNRLPGVFLLHSVKIGDADAPAYELTGRRLTVNLPQVLAPGCTVRANLTFGLQIPQVGVGANGYNGYLGFSARQINLGHWLPTLAVRQDGAWLLHDLPTYGEQTVTDPADWDVTLTVDGASDALEVVGPGTAAKPGAATWHFVLAASRDFTLSMSEDFNRSESVTEGGVIIELYTFDDTIIAVEGGSIDGAEHALDVATRSLAMYADLFGAYPHERFVIVQGDFPDGMEFSNMVFVSGDWFRSYAGEPTSYLTMITVHEVAHQWWYARVGSDQAQTPWLDEALATYSEYIFYEEYYPELREWWWQTRVNTWIPPDFDDAPVNSTVYQFETLREYINAVYLRGARMLHDLRRDLGTDAFFNWLARYAEAGSDRIATPDLFWSLLSPAQMDATRATRDQYMGAAEVTKTP